MTDPQGEERLRVRGQGTPGLGFALLRGWWLIALSAIAVAAVGLLIGLARSPTYRAEAQLNVGRLDVTAQALPGLADSTRSLAATYASLIGAGQIVGPAARQAGVPVSELRDGLSAKAVANSSVLYIDATAPSATQAKRSADAAAQAMVAFIAGQHTSNQDQARLLGSYRRLSARVAGLDSRIGSLGGSIKAGNGSPAKQAKLHRLIQQRDTLHIQIRGVIQTYVNGQFDQSATGGLELISRAQTASSDRAKTAGELGGVGALVGLAIGAALVSARHRRRMIRLRAL